MAKNYNILILNHTREIELLIQYNFRNQPWTLISESSPDRVIDSIHQNNIFLIILDIDRNKDQSMMCLAKIRNFYSNLELPVIIITDLLGGKDVAEGLNAGANDYIRKPFPESEILARVNTHLTLAIKNNELNQSRIHFKNIIDNLPEIIYQIDLRVNSSPVFINKAVESMTGYTTQELQDNPDLVKDLSCNSWNQYIKKLIQLKQKSYISKWLVKFDKIIWVENTPVIIRDKDGKVSKIEGVVRDITTLRAYDVLTGLPNKDLLLDTIAQSIQMAHQDSWLIVFQIRNFSLINQSFGHVYTEKMLQWLTKKFIENVKYDNSIIARIDESKFAIFLNLQANESFDVIKYALGIIDSIAGSFSINNQISHLSIKTGISKVDANMETSQEALLCAEAALFSSINKISKVPVIFHKDIIENSKMILKLESDILDAVQENQFLLYGQPIIDIRTGKIEKVEILLRWNHPAQGLIPPDQFIPYLESSGLIIPVGEWVIKQSCNLLHSLKDVISENFVLAINISAVQLNKEDIADRIKAIILEHNIITSQIELEITESIIFGDGRGQNLLNLENLRETGIRLALDDFGTGYSSLSYLKYFPVNTLKIDRSFILNIESHPKSLSILKSIINLALELELNIVAEGIEEESQFDILKKLGCQYIQGYLIARPMPSHELPAFIQNFHQTKLAFCKPVA